MGHISIHFFIHFCCRMYHLATMHFVTDRQTATDGRTVRDGQYHVNSGAFHKPAVAQILWNVGDKTWK